ncbi:MAG: glyceraldehyde 3-phosphate dehydrogenase NAD-binding domain-containing protein [Nitrospiraceae bacterium]
MTTRIGINGFGRIGRNVLRASMDDPSHLVAINDLTDAKTLAYLLKYDSVHGTLKGTVEAKKDDQLIVSNGRSIKVLAVMIRRNCPGNRWASMSSSNQPVGSPTAKVRVNTSAGAKTVIISAPAKDPDVTVVLGVNEQTFDAKSHHILSNASCTTNCLAPVAKVLLDNFGIKHGVMTTIHSYTNDQQLLDLPHKDSARAAGMSMIPTSTARRCPASGLAATEGVGWPGDPRPDA